MSSLYSFFFTPSSGVRLAVFRMGVSLVLILQALMLIPEFFDFYGTGALIQAPLNSLYSNFVPSITQFALFVSKERWNVDNFIVGMGVCYLIALVGLLFGFYARVFAVFSTLLHLLFMKSHYGAYGVDVYTHIALFYLCFVPSALKLTVESPMSTFGLRLLQIHLCISYLASGIEKASGPQWWNGEVIFRALQMPVYLQWDLTWIHHIAFVLPILTIGTLILEIGYPVFMFWQKTRPYWVVCMTFLHTGIALFMGLEMFGLIMLVFNLTLFGKMPLPFFSRNFLKSRQPLGATC